MNSKFKNFAIETPKDFNFWRTVYSHGWCALLPFCIDKNNLSLNRLFELDDGKLVYCIIKENRDCNICISYVANKQLSNKEISQLKTQAKHILRLDNDLGKFYSIAKKESQFKWLYKIKAGRLLRSPTVFEDVVKMICTTNCSWALTEIMVNNLASKLGKKFTYVTVDGKKLIEYSFPTPESISNVDEKFLRAEIKMGYRAPYLLELARRIKSGSVDLESWRTDNSATDQLYKKILSIKGVGPYATQNLLKLLGRYDYLGIDSWSRAKFFEIHKNGRKVSDKTIEKFYEKYGKWRGLFFWMDVTKHWYEHQFPF